MLIYNLNLAKDFDISLESLVEDNMWKKERIKTNNE